LYFNLADLVTDITQNGAESGADLVELTICETVSEFRFTVKDNGKGMTGEELKKALDPFFTDGIKHPRRKVGLGLPFLIQTAEQCGGGWEMESEKGKGTRVSAWFDLGNVDTPQMGDIPGMFRTVLLFNGLEEMLIQRVRDKPEGRIDYKIRKTELADALGDLETGRSLILLDKYLRSLEENE
jgi:hypothetical protein